MDTTELENQPEVGQQQEPAPESEEVQRLRAEIEEKFKGQLETTQKQAAENERMLRDALLAAMQQRPAADAPKAESRTERAIKHFIEVGYKEEQARSMAAALDEFTGDFLTKDEAKQINERLLRMDIDARTRKGAEAMASDGYSAADASKAAQWVQDQIDKGVLFPSEEIAFAAARDRLNIRKGEDPTVVARRNKLAEQGRADTGEDRSATPAGKRPIPKHIAEISDTFEFLVELEKWNKQQKR